MQTLYYISLCYMLHRCKATTQRTLLHLDIPHLLIPLLGTLYDPLPDSLHQALLGIVRGLLIWLSVGVYGTAYTADGVVQLELGLS